MIAGPSGVHDEPDIQIIGENIYDDVDDDDEEEILSVKKKRKLAARKGTVVVTRSQAKDKGTGKAVERRPRGRAVSAFPAVGVDEQVSNESCFWRGEYPPRRSWVLALFKAVALLRYFSTKWDDFVTFDLFWTHFCQSHQITIWRHVLLTWQFATFSEHLLLQLTARWNDNRWIAFINQSTHCDAQIERYTALEVEYAVLENSDSENDVQN